MLEAFKMETHSGLLQDLSYQLLVLTILSTRHDHVYAFEAITDRSMLFQVGVCQHGVCDSHGSACCTVAVLRGCPWYHSQLTSRCACRGSS
jgi:hypothetical protein